MGDGPGEARGNDEGRPACSSTARYSGVTWNWGMRLTDDIEVIMRSERVETLLEPFRQDIGRDYDGYKGHVYRVLSYAMHFLGGEHRARGVIETALVYHDLALWTHKQIAYLEPSIERAQQDNASNSWGHDPELLRNIIYWHHKITPFRGSNADVVNAVRKADWIDATSGVVRADMPKRHIQKVTNAVPAAGFHDTLKRIGPELAGSAVGTVAGLLKVYKL